MDPQVTKGKRGRPKGSKNKSKNEIDKSLSHRSFQNNTDDEINVVSQMQSFRNSILENLKIELFGKRNDSALSTPPMNFSTLLPTSNNITSDNHSYKQASKVSQLVSDGNSNPTSDEVSSNVILSNKSEEPQIRKRGRPRLSEVQKKSRNRNNKSLDSQISQRNLLSNNTDITKLSSPKQNIHKILRSDAIGGHKIPDKSKDDLFLSSPDKSYNEKNRTGLTPTSSMKKNSSEIEPNGDAPSCSILLKLTTVEQILKELRLSPSTTTRQFRNVDDGSILANIFTKGQVKSTNLRTSIKSKLLRSDKMLSSFSSFCKRRMIKKRSQMNESKILLEGLGSHSDAGRITGPELGYANRNDRFEKENLCISKCNDIAAHSKSFNIAEHVHKKQAAEIGIQCNVKKCLVSTESQTNSNSYRDAAIQTDLVECKQTSDVSTQANLMISDVSTASFCAKCLTSRQIISEKHFGNFQTPSKSIPSLSLSLFNNSNITNSKFDGLLNVQSNFFDSTFLNDLLGTSHNGQVNTTHPYKSFNSQLQSTILNDISRFGSHNVSPRSNFSFTKYRDKNEPSKMEILKRNLTSYESEIDRTNDIETDKDELLDADDDVIIRGNIGGPEYKTTRDDSIASVGRSNVEACLDDGFINETCDHSSGPIETQPVFVQHDSSKMEGRSKKRKRDEADDDNVFVATQKRNKRLAEPINNLSSSEDQDEEFKKTEQKSEKVKLRSPVYKKVKRCTYVDAKPTCKDYEPSSCDCKIKHPDDPKEICCGDSCLNRVVYTECHPSTCPADDKCSNRRIQKRLWVEELVKFQTKDRGFGVKTLRSLSPGQFVIEYCGEVVSENEFRRRMSQDYKNERHHYCLNLDSGMVIDGYRMGNVSRFINHSCQPNCIMEKWNVNGLYRMGLFAIGEIPSGTELTYDYNFHSYNILSQQTCKCGSRNCRGVMAGKNQRLRKNDRIKQTSLRKHPSRKGRPAYLKKTSTSLRSMRANVTTSLPLSSSITSSSSKFSGVKEKVFAQKQRLFLQRNVKKVMKHKMKVGSKVKPIDFDGKHGVEGGRDVKDYGKFLKNLPGFDNMFRARDKPSIRNDRRTNETLKNIFTTVINTMSDVEVGTLHADHPSLRCLTIPRLPNLSTTVQKALSLEAILSNVHLGHYTSFQDFNEDVNKLLDHVHNQEAFDADVEDALLNVRRVYREASKDVIALYSDIVLKPLTPLTSVQSSNDVESKKSLARPDAVDPETDLSDVSACVDSKKDDVSNEVEVIRCVCNIYRDEGLMIQCEKCEKWQHCMCMNVKGDEDRYMCEMCDLRPIVKEVLLIPQPEDALAHCRYYMTLMRDDELQVRVGDCVYVTREGSNIDMDMFKDQSSSHLVKEQLDIFRVERLWRKYNGDGCAFGHYYMRPHETFHEPTRKFYPNEVFRAPLYHVVPLEAVMGTCCVMDPLTYCKGHPIGVEPEDVYICEFRVDKAARLFSRINKSQHTINTNSYCFHQYSTKLKPKRTFMVHQTVNTCIPQTSS